MDHSATVERLATPIVREDAQYLAQEAFMSAQCCGKTEEQMWPACQERA